MKYHNISRLHFMTNQIYNYSFHSAQSLSHGKIHGLAGHRFDLWWRVEHHTRLHSHLPSSIVGLWTCQGFEKLLSTQPD